MVYANFSSNLPTGLQHFEFVDLTSRIDKDEFKSYTEKGFFTIPRHGRFWGSVLSDMILRQVFMHAIKVSGRLT